MDDTERFVRQAVELARGNVARGGRPFGAVIVRDGRVIATGVNQVIETGDPTAHAELEAIRAASRALATPRLDGCVVYASGHPCPMCLGAMYLTGIGRAHYAYSNEEAEAYGLSTAPIYADLARPPAERTLALVASPARMEGEHLYEAWRRQARS